MKLDEVIPHARFAKRGFKRPFEESYWILVKEDGLEWAKYADGKQEPMSVEWMLATDWELEPEQRITITKTQLLEKINEFLKEYHTENKVIKFPAEVSVQDLILHEFGTFAKKLGFK